MNNEKEESIFITTKAIVAIFSSYSIQQSPYKVPENLEKAILRFHLMLEEYFSDSLTIEDEWIQGKFKEREWKEIIENIILDEHFIEVRNWNNRKNPYRLLYPQRIPKDPDNSFIDIWALAKNVAYESWHKAILTAEEYMPDLDEKITPVTELPNG